jgi:ElaB/YqjD/DUF883 family membrane-anchored ribosome-binding protein
MEASQREGQEGQVQEAADQAREKVGEAADQAKQTAQNVASQAQDRVREQVDQRSTDAGERVGGTAEDIRSVGQELRKQGKEGPAKLAEQAAERIDRAGSYLRESDADRILNDAEDFARRQPWAVLAGAVVVGLAAARFLKASSHNRYSSRQSDSSAGSSGTRRELSPSTTPEPQSAPAEDVRRQAATPAGVR